MNNNGGGNQRAAGLDLGGPVIGVDAKRRRWHEWVIAQVAGRTVIGRLKVRERKRYLSPVYDFISGFQPAPGGVAEIHKAFPFMALTISEIELPEQGVLLVPFTALDGAELDGLEGCIADAEELLKQQRAARSGLVIADKIPPLRHS